MNLKITNNDDTVTLLSCQVTDNLDVADLTIAVLGAIKALKPPKATRSDAGTPRGPRKPAVVPKTEAAA